MGAGSSPEDAVANKVEKELGDGVCLEQGLFDVTNQKAARSGAHANAL